jgi:poly-gamma-glutamate capsule biosynthesis protein CapA/YwtB (metallophosphatase superfamily)
MKHGLYLLPAVLAGFLLGGAQAAPVASVRFAAVGDIAMAPSSDSTHFFSRVRYGLAGDVVLGNLEGTLATGGESKCKSTSTDCFAFRAPPAYSGLLKSAGFTILNLANNHADDYGQIGRIQTLRALRRYGLRETGRPGEITVVRAHGIRIAVLGFAPYPWAQRLTNIGAAKRLVRRASARADVVIVAMHAGAEGTAHQHVTPGTEVFLGENRGNSVAFSHAVIDAGADLVVGSGPHVLRGMEWYRGRLIAYSLGNFAGYKVFSLGGRLSTSAILQLTLRGNGTIENASLVATRMVDDGVPALDPSKEAYAVIRSLSSEDFGSAGATISSTGTIRRA